MKRNMIFFAAFLTILLIAYSGVAAPTEENLIGYRHKGVLRGETLPNGAKDLGGGLMSNENYGVTRFLKGKKYMLWLERIVDRDDEGVPFWEVKDVLKVEFPKKNQEYLLSLSSPCRLNRRADLDLIVLAEREPRQKSYKVLKAWRANLKKERFEEISTKRITC